MNSHLSNHLLRTHEYPLRASPERQRGARSGRARLAGTGWASAASRFGVTPFASIRISLNPSARGSFFRGRCWRWQVAALGLAGLFIVLVGLAGGTLDVRLNLPVVSWPGVRRGENILIEFDPPGGAEPGNRVIRTL